MGYLTTPPPSITTPSVEPAIVSDDSESERDDSSSQSTVSTSSSSIWSWLPSSLFSISTGSSLVSGEEEDSKKSILVDSGESSNISPGGNSSASLPYSKQLIAEKVAPRFRKYARRDGRGRTSKRLVWRGWIGGDPESSCLKRRAAKHRDEVGKFLLLNSAKRRCYREAAQLPHTKKKAGDDDYYSKSSGTKITKETLRHPRYNCCSVLETLPAQRAYNALDGDPSDSSSATSSCSGSSTSSSASCHGILKPPMIREDKDDMSVLTGDTSIATYNNVLRFL
jgi:hypothetical protein